MKLQVSTPFCSQTLQIVTKTFHFRLRFSRFAVPRYRRSRANSRAAVKLPTASAVVADVIDALKNGVKIHDSLFWQESAPIEGLYGDSTPADHYVRLENATEAVAKDLFGQQIEMLDTSDGEAVFTLRGVTSGRLAELCAKARAAGVRVGNTLKWMAE